MILIYNIFDKLKKIASVTEGKHKKICNTEIRDLSVRINNAIKTLIIIIVVEFFDEKDIYLSIIQ